MLASASHKGNVFALIVWQRERFGWRIDEFAGVAGSLAHAALSVVVMAPGPELTVPVDDSGVLFSN